NSVDDMKDRWRSRPETLTSEPDYVPNLLADCKAILERMDRRLGEYRDLGKHVVSVAAELKEKREKAKGDASADERSFASALQLSQGKLKSLSAVSVTPALGAIGKIGEKLQRDKAQRIKAAELDRIAEAMRDIANRQEVHLKKLRTATLKLAEV